MIISRCTANIGIRLRAYHALGDKEAVLIRRVNLTVMALAVFVMLLLAAGALAAGRAPVDVAAPHVPPVAEEAKAPPAGPGADITELAPGVWAFVGENGSTNSGFVVTTSGVVVIDSQGPSGRAMLLKEKIKEVTEMPVTYVINTHYHGDHTFGNQYFPGAVIVSHANTRALLSERDAAHRERFMGFFGPESLDGFVLTLPSLTFTDSLTLHSGATVIEIIYAGHPAHTAGDAFVYLPGEKVVFAGDLLYNGRLPLLDDGDSSGAIAALDMLANTGALKFVPGHGPVSGPEGIILYRGYLTELRGEVRWLKEKGRSMEEVMEEIELPRYSGYVNYGKWLPANAAKVYRELESR